MRTKRKYILFSALFGVCALGGGIFTMPKMHKADAATFSGKVFEEDFSSKTLSDKWIKNDFSLDDDSYYSMRFVNQTGYGAAMLYTDYQIHDDCVISFDFRQSDINAEKASANWFGVLFGYNDDSKHFTGGNAALLSYGSGLTQLMDNNDGKSNTLVSTSYNDHSKYLTSFLLDAVEKTYTVELVLTYTGMRYSDGESLYQVDAYYYEKSSERPLTPKYTYKGIAADGYFGFSAMASAVLDISDLKITENGETVVYENFQKTDGTGKKLLSVVEGSAWKGCNLSETKVYSCFNGRMDASGKNKGLLLGAYDLRMDNKSEKAFEITVETEIQSLPKNSAFGLVTGLSRDSVSASDGSFVGICGIDEETFEFVHVLNGETIASTQSVPKKLYGNGQTALRFIGYYDGRLDVTLGEYTVSFESAAKNGLIGFATFGTNACQVYFDAIRIVRSSYVSSSAPNLAIDFTGVKETVEDDFTYVERYVNERVWFLGSGVAFQKVFRQDATFIQFTDSNERTFFGPKQTYSEFICRFSITVTQDRADSKGAYIGLSFGKENRNDRAADSPSVLFGMTDSGMILQGKNCMIGGADASGMLKQYETYPQLDFWSAEDWAATSATYRVMVVVRGGVGYVYYANEADLSGMSECKAVLTGMETSGYVTVCGLGGATFKLNDFSVTNISVDAKAETSGIGANETDLEYANVDFVNDALYAITGTAEKTKDGISLGYDSQLTVQEKYTDFLAYVDVNGVYGEGLEIKIGQDFIRLHADGGIYSNMTQKTDSRIFDFQALKNGGIIMIEVLGKQVSVGVVDKVQPSTLLENRIAVFERKSQTDATEISVSTIEQTVVSLESVRVYTLKPTIAMEADNWEASDTERPEKNAPNNADENAASGCSSSLTGGMSVLLLLFAVAAILIRKKGGIKNERI